MADHDTHDHTGVPGVGVPADILDIPTAETDDTLVLAPDGAGGVEFRAEAGGGGGALVLLEQHTASSSAQLDFTTFISSTYDEYRFEFVNIIPATDAAAFRMRAGTGGGPTYDTGNNYTWGGWRWVTTGVAGAVGGAGVAFIQLCEAIDTSNANHNSNGHLTLFNPASAIFKPVIGQFVSIDEGAAALIGTSTFGNYNSTTAMTAVRFYMSTGNIASGTIRAYGVAK